LISHKDIVARVSEMLRKEGYLVNAEATVYKNFVADILAEKNAEKHLIEIKTNRKEIISALVQIRELAHLPYISTVSLALPSEEVQEDIVEIAGRSGVGLYSVSPTDVKLKMEPQKLTPGTLSGSGSYQTPVAPGQIFDVRASLTANERIFTEVKLDFLIGDPFFVPEGEVTSKTIDEIMPGKTVDLTLKVGVSKHAKPGRYYLFVERKAHGVPISITAYDIDVQVKNGEIVEKDVHNSISLLNHAITTNLENTLRRIDEAMLEGTLDIRDHVIDKSIWGELGNFCFLNGLYRQAQLTYGRMLETITKWEEKYKQKLHKGLALYSLGMALYFQGEPSKAKSYIEKAYQEDKRTFGETQAEKLPAKTTLGSLFKEA